MRHVGSIRKEWKKIVKLTPNCGSFKGLETLLLISTIEVEAKETDPLKKGKVE